MGDHGRGGSGASGGGRRPASGSGSAGAPAPDPADRPGASGHRFGPGLVCSECGIRWDAHQRSPHPCTLDLPADPFARRPGLVDPVEPPRRSRPSPSDHDHQDEGDDEGGGGAS
ncbi:hypothetical protein K2X89_13765 [Myxococcota bacterium]|nr:hypothetical protein [Myxococcota bacterium]